jgi:hypothetical protein
MARRAEGHIFWTLDRRVPPKRALKHVAAAIQQCQAWCDNKGISLESADQLMQRLADQDRLHAQAANEPG